MNPVLTMLPLGLLGAAVLVDLGALISGSHLFGVIAHADLGVGLLAGCVSLCAVLIDLITAPPGTVVRQALSVVAALTGSMIIVFALIWSVRADGDPSPNGFVVLAELAALATGAIAGGLLRRLALGHALPHRYLGAGALAERYLVEAPVRAAGVVRRTVPLGRLMR